MRLTYKKPKGSYTYKGIRYDAGVPNTPANADDAEYLLDLGGDEELFVAVEDAEVEAEDSDEADTPSNVHINTGQSL